MISPLRLEAHDAVIRGFGRWRGRKRHECDFDSPAQRRLWAEKG